jgi:hypothetical protein
MVFIASETDLIDSNPSLTQIARIPAEVGRIEFKAFDSCGDFELYGSLLTLLKGLVLDETLAGRATVPNTNLHQQSAQLGFADEQIYTGAWEVFEAVAAVISSDSDRDRLNKLRTMLDQCYSPAQAMLNAYKQGQPIHQILQRGYALEGAQVHT